MSAQKWVVAWAILALVSITLSTAIVCISHDYAHAALAMAWACYAELRRQANVRGIP